MSKIPLICNIKSKISFPSPSYIFMGCNAGLKPSHKCTGCPKYNGGLGGLIVSRKND